MKMDAERVLTEWSDIESGGGELFSDENEESDEDPPPGADTQCDFAGW